MAIAVYAMYVALTNAVYASTNHAKPKKIRTTTATATL